MSRREFLATTGAGALGTGAALVLAGCGVTHRAPHGRGDGGHDADVGSGSHSDGGSGTGAESNLARGPFLSEPSLRPPEILLDRRPADPSGDAFVITDAHGGDGQQGPMIIDRAGRLRWFVPVSDNGSRRRRAMNVRVQRYRGRPVLSYWIGALRDAHGSGHYEIYDERYRRIATVRAGDGLRGDLHEFVITEQGTALLTAYGEARGLLPTDDGTIRTGPYFYCCCQEVDIATGRLLLNWRSDEHTPLSASRLPLPKRHDFPWDYFHMNSINVDPADGNLIVSSRNLWQVYKIDRRSGETIWRLGGTGSDFELEPRAAFAFQHDVTPHAGGFYTIFDNEAGPPFEAAQSRGLVIDVRERQRSVRFLREYHHVPPLLSKALGSVQATAGGGAFVGWGDSSYFTEWDGRGEVILDGRLSDGAKSYRAFQQPWKGVPAQPPRFAVVRHGRRATLYVSWNGATVHRRWRVLGGTRSERLSELTTTDVDGFETAIELAHAPDWVKVEAVGHRGDVVGHSEVLRLSS